MMGHDLVVTESDISLGVKQDHLVLKRGEYIVKKTRLQDLEQVILMGGVEVSAQARQTLLRLGIDLVFMSPKGQYQGRLMGRISKNIPLRMAQYDGCRDPKMALAIARQMVGGKVKNQRRFLMQGQRELKSEAMAYHLARLRILIKQIQGAESIASLMGYEGAAAACYFKALPLLIKKAGFDMLGRSKRPPRDPVNAMLSFGYSLLTSQMESLVLRAGLDPYLGCLHQVKYGMPALVLDLIEEFRPVVVDALVLRLINKRQIKPGDFYQPEDVKRAEDILFADAEPNFLLDDPETSGLTDSDVLDDGSDDPRPAVYLGDVGRKLFFQGFYQRLRETLYYPPLDQQTDLKRLMALQVYHLARVFEGENSVYIPYTPK